MTIFGIIFFVTTLISLGILIYRSSDVEWSFFGSVIIILVIFSVFVGLGSINSKYEKSDIAGVTYISSISANSDVSGHFFLGSGNIENKSYYYYATNSDKGYQIDKMEITSNVYIKEDNEHEPYIEFTKYNATHINWFGKLFFKSKLYNYDGEIIFHVPVGTIVGDYSIDVSNL